MAFQFPPPYAGLAPGAPMPAFPNLGCYCGLQGDGCLCCSCGLQNNMRWDWMPAVPQTPVFPQRYDAEWVFKGVEEPITGGFQVTLGSMEELLEWHQEANTIWWAGTRSGPELPAARALLMGRDPDASLRQTVGLRSRGAQDLLEASLHIQCTTNGGRSWLQAVGTREGVRRGLPGPVRYVLRTASVSAEAGTAVNRSVRPYPRDGEIAFQSTFGAPGPVDIGTQSGLSDTISVFRRTQGGGIDVRTHAGQDALAGGSAFSMLHECRVPVQQLSPGGEETIRASEWLYGGLRGAGTSLSEIVIPRHQMVAGPDAQLMRTVRGDMLPAWVRYFINRYESRKANGVVNPCCAACWRRINRVAEAWLTRGL